MNVRCLFALGMAALASTACGGDSKSASTGDCPDTLSYTKTAKPFVDMYCTSCHSETVTAAKRGGAPVGVDFDDEAGLFTHGTHVYEYVLDGTMPPAGEPKPTATERKAFADWAKCSGVSEHHDEDASHEES